MKILAINPGSTSTKIAVFEDYEQAFTKTLRHSAEEIGKYPNIVSQFEFRKKMIVEALKENDIALKDIAAIVGRGGLLRPIPSGVYEVNDRMLADLRSGEYGEHASNLGSKTCAPASTANTPATWAASWPTPSPRRSAAAPSSPTRSSSMNCATWPASPVIRSSNASPCSTPSTRKPSPRCMRRSRA